MFWLREPTKDALNYHLALYVKYIQTTHDFSNITLIKQFTSRQRYKILNKPVSSYMIPTAAGLYCKHLPLQTPS